ncbi:DUF4178 domain-containing protein [Gorillibacterium sp. CAU 1737]|uniref:DUF4178 domain-containing protein n=1 Tax=Gorillibacterium sp. CAU 1737 TaxID=3140362 RepID=UPI00326013D3
MSMLKRMGAIWRSRKEAPAASERKPMEDARPGDIVSVELNQYVVSGKVAYYDTQYAPHRYAYYLRDGNNVSCLLIEKGRTDECFLCEFLEGSLDDPSEVPTRLDVDGEVAYDLEWQRTDRTRTEGQTDFRNGDEVILWRYSADSEGYFFLQWQDGKFVAMKGERLAPGEVRFLLATDTKGATRT